MPHFKMLALTILLLAVPFSEASAQQCSGTCGVIEKVGCCKGSINNPTTSVFCESNTLICEDCSAGCGWIASKQWYDCVDPGQVPNPDPSGVNPWICPNFCSPTCGGKACGNDGCGGSCGSCPSGTSCTNFQCLPGNPDTPSCEGQCGGKSANGNCWCDETCVDSGDCCEDACLLCGFCDNGPCVGNCVGKTCGDNGCGGSCGLCTTGSVCQNGQCIPTGPQGAGTCVGYCGEKGSDKICWCDDQCIANADCCPDACNACSLCGDCTPNCTGRQCGSDGCGGICGNCPAGMPCSNGICQGCQPSCIQKNCGDDGCGGTCGACAANEICDTASNVWSCVTDPNTGGTCSPLCTGKVCGSDSCGGSCGACPTGEICTGGGTLCLPSGGSNPDANDGVLVNQDTTASGGTSSTTVKEGCRSHGGASVRFPAFLLLALFLGLRRRPAHQ